MTIFEAIESIDLEEVIDGMSAYANRRLKSYNLKNFNGLEPIDFVQEVITKALEGTRDWGKADCTIKEFLFGILRSDINNFFKTNKIQHVAELDRISQNDNSQYSYEELKQLATELLIKEGANDDELTIFEYWVDGIRKPREISKELDVDVKEIYVISKRLERRLLKIEPRFKN